MASHLVSLAHTLTLAALAPEAFVTFEDSGQFFLAPNGIKHTPLPTTSPLLSNAPARQHTCTRQHVNAPTCQQGAFWWTSDDLSTKGAHFQSRREQEMFVFTPTSGEAFVRGSYSEGRVVAAWSIECWYPQGCV